MQDAFSPSQGSGSSAVGGQDERVWRVVAFPWSRREDLKALGGAVRELRARRYISQERLGELAGTHRNHVGGLERGEQNITFRMLVQLSRGLGVTLSELAVMYERNRMRQLGILPPPLPGHTSGSREAGDPPSVVGAGAAGSGSADPAPGGSPTRRASQRSAEPPAPLIPIDRSVARRTLR